MSVEFRNFLSVLSDVSDINNSNEVISFRYKGLSFLYIIDEDDQYYVRLVLPKIASKSDLKDKTNVYEIINKFNEDYKIIKMVLIEDYIWLSVEQFLYSKENSNVFFARIIKILISVIESFRKQYLK